MCVCVYERERERECVCVSMCVRERERERESVCVRERESMCVCPGEKKCTSISALVPRTNVSLVLLKGTVHPKNLNSVINYPHVVPNPFIFRTQIKIFLIKSESFLVLYRQQGNYHDQTQKRSTDIVKIIHVTSHNFTKLCFCAQRKQK